VSELSPQLSPPKDKPRVVHPARPAAPPPTGLRRALILGVVGVPLIVVVLAAVALPAAVSWSLVGRGIGEVRVSWVALGALTAALWALMLWLTARKLWRERAEKPAA
jgi:hypothetical protein